MPPGKGETASVPFFSTEHPADVISESGVRLDNRTLEEFRQPFLLKTGILSQASGSAYLELGLTKVMVGVYGPRQSDKRFSWSEQGRLQVDVKLASFSTRQRGRPGQSPQEKDLSLQLTTALESAVFLDTFPKAALDVYCTVLEVGGGELGAVITAASAAIASAGVAMRNMVAACTVSCVKGRLLLDPSSDEEYREDCGLMLATLGPGTEVSQIVSWGKWDNSSGSGGRGLFQEAVELAMGGCAQIESAVRGSLKEGSG